jgi:hypothetical protein
MKNRSDCLLGRTKVIASSLLVAITQGAFAATHYVDLSSSNPTPPYTNWATAATNIQDAVDIAEAGDEVIVTNGVYASGGRVTGTNAWANRVAVEKALTLRSVNGPQFTVIKGNQGLVRSNWVGSARCAYLTSGSYLSGFSLMNGASDRGAGVWCETTTAVISNCWIVGNWAFDDWYSGYETGYGGGAYGGTLRDCTSSNNHAVYGAGAYGSILRQCSLSSNVAESGFFIVGFGSFMNYGGYGGAAYGCRLIGCTISSSSAVCGGGAANSTLDHCTLASNSAIGSENIDRLDNGWGGGAFQCTIADCTLAANSAQIRAGAAEQCFLTNCILTSNWGGVCGGAFLCTLVNCSIYSNSSAIDFSAAAHSTLHNCTVVSNQGGVFGCALFNSIVISNDPFSNYDASTVQNYCCTTPMPAEGIGNITNAPLFVDLAGGDLRLQPNSPCINAGNNDYVTTATDVDGNPRILGGTVDIGAYEFASPELLVQHLIELVNESNLSAKRPLLASLEAALSWLRREAALSSLGRSEPVFFLNQLQSFQNKVRAQVEPLDPVFAMRLTGLAQKIASALDAEKGAGK